MSETLADLMSGSPIRVARLNGSIGIATERPTTVGHSVVDCNFDDTMRSHRGISYSNFDMSCDGCADEGNDDDDVVVVVDQNSNNVNPDECTNHYHYETDVATSSITTEPIINYWSTARDHRCIVHGLLCCYTVCDCNCDIIGISHNHDCLCIRYNCCCAYNHKSYGTGNIITVCDEKIHDDNTNNKNDVICSIQLYCIELGMILPSSDRICKFVHHSCCCIQSVGSFPLHHDYVTEPVLAYSCIQCYPVFGRGCCVTPPKYSRYMDSLLLDNAKRQTREQEHIYTLPLTQIEMLRE